jgi:hypothetical protein
MSDIKRVEGHTQLACEKIARSKKIVLIDTIMYRSGLKNR